MKKANENSVKNGKAKSCGQKSGSKETKNCK